MSLVTGTASNDSKTFNAGDDYSLSAGTDTLVFNQTDADLTSTTLTSVEVLQAGLSLATTFTVDKADLATGGSVVGSSGIDTLIIQGTAFNLLSTTLTDIEVLQAGSTAATTFTVDAADLASGGSVIANGSTVIDTLVVKNATINLTSTGLDGIEILKAGVAAATNFVVDKDDLAANGSVVGSSGADTLTMNDVDYDLTSTVLTSIEKLVAGSTSDTTFTVNRADLASGGSVTGNVGSDTLIITGTTSFDLSSSAVTNVENLQGSSSLATTFTVDQGDLAANGSITGSSGIDTVTTKGSALDLTSTTLDSIETLKAISATGTKFTVDALNLGVITTITGSTGVDTVAAGGAALDLTSTTLSSVEKLQGSSIGTTFTVDGIGVAGADLVSGGSVIGVGTVAVDTLIINGTVFDLTSTTLTNIEVLQASSGSDTKFTVDANDLISGGDVIGGAGSDTLIVKGTAFNLSSTTLTDVEKLQASSTAATTFTVNQADLASGGSVLANALSTVVDTLVVKDAAIDLTSTTLTGIEVLKAGISLATTFTVNQLDLASGGSIIGSSSSDTLAAGDTELNLSSSTLTSIERLEASVDGTTFTINQADLASNGSVTANGGTSSIDTLVIVGTGLDLSSTTLTSVEILKAGTTLATIFTVNQGDLAAGGTVQGSSGTDTLTTKNNALDLTSTTLDSVEVLKAGSAAATIFTVDTDDFTKLTAISGSTGSDTLIFTGTDYDLTSRALSSIEVLSAGSSIDTTFTVDAADLASGGGVIGSTGNDTLVIQGAIFNLASTGITSVEKLQTGSSLATTFTLDQADLVSGGSVIGSSGVDTLVAKGATLDLSSTSLTSIEKLQGTLAATTFTVDQADLNSVATITGSTGVDTLAAGGTAFDLTSMTLSSIEKLQGAAGGTSFTVNAAQLVAGGSVGGTGGTDALTIKGTAFDVTSTTLTSIEILNAGSSLATTFTVDQADLASSGAVNGSSGSDTLIIKGTGFNLSSTTLTSVERLQAGSTAATTFTVDALDLVSSGSVIANGSSVIDTLVVKDAAIDLTSTTLTGIEVLKAGLSVATTFTVNQLDLASGGSVIGSSSSDTLTTADAALDLTSTILTSIEKLQAASSGTTFTVDAADLVSGGSVAGGAGADALIIKGTAFDLTSTTATSIETLQAGSSLATTFTVDAGDLASGGAVIGSSGNDTLTTKGTLLDLTSTTLTSIETLKAGSAAATTFKIDPADFTTLTAILGSSGNDTLSIKDAAYDLSSTALTSIERLEAGSTDDTTFTVDQADLASGGSVIGNTGTDTLAATGATLDLTSTTLSSAETLQAASVGTTFTVDAADLLVATAVTGGAGTDTLIVKGTSFDLSSTAATGVEILKAGSSLATTFTVNQADLAAGGSVQGSTGVDTLAAAGAALDLTSTTLTSIEKLQAASVGTTFTVDAADLVSGGSVAGGVGSDTLIIKGASFDITSTGLTNIEILKAGSSVATTFTVDQADLDSGVTSIVGSSGVDTLTSNGTALSLANTALTSVEILQAGSSLATTFTLDGTDLTQLTTINGSSGNDTLVGSSTGIDLSSTTLNSIEVLKAGLGIDTTFTVNQADLATGGSVIGSSGSDTLTAGATSLDLTSTTLTSIEKLQGTAAGTVGTTFTVDAADLVSGGTVAGSSAGLDTLIIAGTSFDLSSTTTTSIEALKAGSSLATTFTVDQADLTSGGSIVGSSGSDTLTTKSNALDLTSTSLTSVETLKAGSSLATTFTIDTDDFSKLTSIVGNSGSDTLTINGTAFDLSSTALTSIENLSAGSTLDTTFTVDAADLANGSIITGNAGNDTLVINGTSFDTSSVTLSSVEVLKAGSSLATTFTVDQNDLATGGTVQGNSGNDTLVAAGTLLDLTSITLASIEILKAGSSLATTFTVDAADLVAAGSVTGSSGNDTLTIVGTAFDLSSTTLTSIEALTGGSSLATTFTVDKEDLAAGGSVTGSTGNDTLIVKGLAFDLTSSTVTNIEILQAASNLATTFTVDAGDLAAGGTVQGGSANDILIIKGTAFDLSSTTLSSIEVLKAGSSLATTFTLDASDLANGGSLSGSSGVDTLIVSGNSIDLSSTTVSSVEVLKAGSSNATTFTVAALGSFGTVVGSSGVDTLVVKNAAIDLSTTTLTSIEVLKAGLSVATTFTVDQADLASGGSVQGSSGNDTLTTKGTALDLSSTALTSIENLKAGNSLATTFTVDQVDLVASGSVTGSSGNDTLIVKDAAVDLTSTNLTSIEILKAGTNAATTFTVDAADLISGGSVVGSTGSDTLIMKTTAFDLSSTTLTSIETLQAGLSLATTFTVDQADLVAGGSVVGSSGIDILVTTGTGLDLTSTTLNSIETLKAGTSNATTFTVDQADLIAGGNVIGSSGNDTLSVIGTAANLTSTTLGSVEILKAGSSIGTTFTIDQADLASSGTVLGSSGTDTLVINGVSLDLTSTSLDSVEILQAGSASNTTFTLDQADLIAGGSIIGSTGSDTVAAGGQSLDLSSTTLTSIENLKASLSIATIFTVDQADLVASGSVTGSTGNDTLAIKGASLDLSSTSLSSVEILAAGSSLDTTFIVDAADLLSGGSVVGSTGNDKLFIIGTTAFNLSSTSLTSVEILQSGTNAATTFTVDQADLIGGGSVIGTGNSDTLTAFGTSLDLSNTTLTSIEQLRAGSSLATTFIVDQADLISGGSITGSTGSDILQASGTLLDLSSTTLTSIETLKAGLTLATTFVVDQADLVASGSVTGNSGNDTLTIAGASLNLTSTVLTSVEKLAAGTSLATTFTVDAADLLSGGSVTGSSGTDTLIMNTTAFNLISTTLTSVENLQAGLSTATTFTVDQADLNAGGAVIGSSGSDILLANGTTLDLSSTTLTSIETLKSGSNATIFTVDQADLVASGSVTGSTGSDSLVAAGTQLNLTSTTITSVEKLAAGTSLATTFTVDAADLLSGGSVTGSSGIDTLIMNTTAFNLISTTLTSVENLQAGLAGATTFTVDQADLIAGGAVIGSSGSDILLANGTTLDLSSTTLTSIETLKSGSTATIFTVDQADLVASGSVTGSTGSDSLVAAGTQLNLTSTTITSVEKLAAGTSLATTFTVDAADLVAAGSVTGSSGTDTLIMNTTAFNLISTTLTSVEVLQAGLSTATTFTVDQADLIAGGSVIGSSGSDILLANGTALDLSSTTLTSIETIKSGSVATTFTVDQTDLVSGGSVTGSTGSDILVAFGTELNLSSTAVTSVETLKAGSSLATTFTVDQGDVATTGSITGSSGVDTLAAAGTSLDLSSTVLTSIEILKAANSLATTFTVDPADLLSGGSVIGNSGFDTLAVKLSTVDLTSTTLTSIEIIDAALTTATLFTVNQADLASGGTVSGNAAVNDTLTIAGTTLDLSSTVLTSVEIITTNSTLATTFIVDQADLASTGSVTGLAGSDTLTAAGTTLDLTSTVLTSIETLKAGTSIATTFTVDAADLLSGGSVTGGAGLDTLAMKTTSFDLTSTTLTSIERLTAGLTTLTTFTVNQADLISGGSVTGTGANNDILTISGTSLDLTSTTLTSVESLKAGLSTATTFIVDANGVTDLASGGSVTGSSGNDTLAVAGTSLDLTSTTLSSIEILKANLSLATTFTVDMADLIASGSVTGSSGTDTLIVKATNFDVSSTTLTSIDVLQAGVSTATTFTVDQADLATNGSVIGSSGNDTLLVKNASYDLTATILSSIEILQAGVSLATVFTLDQADLASGGTVAGSTGSDTLSAAGAALDLTSTTLTSVEIIRAGTGVATTFTLDASDLASGGTVWGSSGNDQLVIKGTAYDLTSTTLTSIEILQTGSSLATTFTLDTSDLLAGGSVVGSSGVDTLTVLGTNVDLTSTTLTSIEVLKTVSSLATTFLVDQADLLSGGSVVGSSGNDTLSIVGAGLDLSSTTLNSIEILQAGTVAATTFTVDQADLLSGGSVIGNSGIDILTSNGNAIDLTSTTLSSIEVLHAGSILATTFTVNQADLISGGSVTGNIGADTLLISGTSLDLTSTSLSSVEFIRAGLSLATTFTVDQSDLASNGAVIGSSGNDTLVINGTSLDLSSASLSSVEILKAGSSLATTFTVDQDDLAMGGSVIGSSGSDTLIVNGHSIDLSNTILTSIETIQTSAPSASTNFAVGSGIGGATIELTANGVIDTVALASGYKVADVTNDATILSHSVTLSHFADGVGGDVIDLSAITNGTPTSSVDVTGYIALSAPATLKDALDIAATANGSTTASVVTFQYGGDTYVLVDNSASHSLTTDDVVVKLTGTHTLSDASNITF